MGRCLSVPTGITTTLSMTLTSGGHEENIWGLTLWEEIVVPPDYTTSACNSLRMQTSHFMTLWKEVSWIPLAVILLGTTLLHDGTVPMDTRLALSNRCRSLHCNWTAWARGRHQSCRSCSPPNTSCRSRSPTPTRERGSQGSGLFGMPAQGLSHLLDHSVGPWVAALGVFGSPLRLDQLS